MTGCKEDVHNQAVVVASTPERRRRVYAAAAARLQRFADTHPDVRYDSDTPEISRAIESIDVALMVFMEGKCGREQVSAAFDRYERALIDASQALKCASTLKSF